VEGVAFSGDGSKVIAAARSFYGGVNPAYGSGVAVSQDAKIAAAPYGTVYVWQTSDGQPLQKLAGQCPAIVETSDSVAKPCEGAVFLWDIAHGALLKTLVGHTASMYSVGFSPDDTLLASGSEDGTVRLWTVGGH
jgi:WD40 repeat protein